MNLDTEVAMEAEVEDLKAFMERLAEDTGDKPDPNIPRFCSRWYDTREAAMMLSEILGETPEHWIAFLKKDRKKASNNPPANELSVQYIGDQRFQMGISTRLLYPVEELSKFIYSKDPAALRKWQNTPTDNMTDRMIDLAIDSLEINLLLREGFRVPLGFRKRDYENYDLQDGLSPAQAETYAKALLKAARRCKSYQLNSVTGVPERAPRKARGAKK